MSNKSWAEREIEIAKKREAEKASEKGDSTFLGYVNMCYDSALKAYNSLMGDGHSGMSWFITASILKRLMDDKPLTPITEEDFLGDVDALSNVTLKRWGLKSSKQCPRMSSLFRDETFDGKVTYHDNSRVVCQEVGKDVTFSNRFVSDYIDELYPITLPYSGDDRYHVYVNEYSTPNCNEDYDVIEINSISKNGGDPVPVRKFFKEVNHDMVEMTDKEVKHLLENS